MINTLAQVDLVASSGRSPWHRASAISKLVLAALGLALALAAPTLPLQAALYAAAVTLLATSSLPARVAFAAATYPLLFVALFVALRWDGTLDTAARLALRPLTATAFTVWLVATTPYPDLFAPLSRVLPRPLADGLFLTYRALFAFVARSERLFRALRLRGGDRLPPRRRLTVAGEGIGTLLLHGFERSERLHAAMRLRGHDGRICGCRHWAEWTAADLAVGAAAGGLAGVAAGLWGAP